MWLLLRVQVLLCCVSLIDVHEPQLCGLNVQDAEAEALPQVAVSFTVPLDPDSGKVTVLPLRVAPDGSDDQEVLGS